MSRGSYMFVSSEGYSPPFPPLPIRRMSRYRPSCSPTIDILLPCENEATPTFVRSTFVPRAVQLLATRTKDAERVVCRNSMSRRRNRHRLIEVAEIGNGIEMGRQTGNENGCLFGRVTRRTQIFIQVKLQFR